MKAKAKTGRKKGIVEESGEIVLVIILIIAVIAIFLVGVIPWITKLSVK